MGATLTFTRPNFKMDGHFYAGQICRPRRTSVTGFEGGCHLAYEGKAAGTKSTWHMLSQWIGHAKWWGPRHSNNLPKTQLP